MRAFQLNNYLAQSLTNKNNWKFQLKLINVTVLIH